MRHKLSRLLSRSRALWVLGILLLLGSLQLTHFPQADQPRDGVARAGGRGHILPFSLLRPPLLAAQQTAGLEPSPSGYPKLNSRLAELARAVPQRRGPIAEGERIPPPAGFSVEKLPKSVRDSVRTRRMRINNDAEVQVYILVDEVTDEKLDALRRAGATVELKDAPRRLVQARVPVTRLEEVADLPFVQFVRLPNYGIRRTGSVDTQGDAILLADQVRSMLHVDGSGVRVGVISDGLKGVFASGSNTTVGPTTASPSPITLGDLPMSTGTRNSAGVLTSSSGGITGQSFDAMTRDLEGLPPPSPPCGFPGAGAEGTALLEIVHDIAPGAQLFFANFSTDLEFKQAVNSLASKTDVVMDDIGFLGEPYDGTSAMSSNTASALNNSANPIRAYFTAVGNEADSHYLGDYVDSKMDGTSIVGAAGDLHLFQPTADTVDVLRLGPTVKDKILLEANGEVVIFLTWNDPFGSSTNDYDLYLVQESNGKVVSKGVGKTCEAPLNNPVECIDYTNPALQGYFDIIVQNPGNKAAVKTLNMFLFEPECAVAGPRTLPGAPNHEKHNYNTRSSSIIAESDAGGSPVSVISVGAICSGSAAATAVLPACGTDPSHTTIEFFSSIGPTVDGRLKPDVTGIDGVSVTGAGSFENPFFGTSAATPHGVGIGALLLQAAPCLLSSAPGARDPVTARTTLRGLVWNNAVNIGSPIPNDTFGFGRIDALAAANRTIPAANAGPNRIVSGGSSITLDGSGSSDPDGCPLTFNWTGTCGTATGAKPSVNCPPGTNNVALTVTNNNVTISSASSAQITVTDFMVGTSPSSATVSPGKSATFTVTVKPQFGPFSNAVALSCSNLPGGAACNFTPSTLTPNSSATTSTLKITTTAPAASLRWPFGPHGQGLLPGLWISLAGCVLCGLGVMQKRSKLRRLGFYLSMGLVLLFLGSQAACGGGGGGQPAMGGGTPKGTFAVTVKGTFGTLQHSMTANLVVQ